MNNEHLLMTVILLAAYFACIAAVVAVFWLGMRSLTLDGREGRAALALELDRRSQLHGARLARATRAHLARMDAHIAMVLERVDRDRD